MSAPDPIFAKLFPNGAPTGDKDLDRAFELYKIMVASSESLVSRRQGVNTFFITLNGALLTAIGLIITNGKDRTLGSLGVATLAITGALIAVAWASLIKSFGQLNTGKFQVINRMEGLFPGAVFEAEWLALGEGKDPKVYRSFTSREVWTPRILAAVYMIATIAAVISAATT